MFFLATQIFTWILVASLFGGLVGWWLHKLLINQYDITPVMMPSKSNSGGSGPGTNSISVLSDSLLQTQRELQECQQSLAIAESRLGELDPRYTAKGSTSDGQSMTIADSTSTMSPTAETESYTEISYEDDLGEIDDLTRIHGIGPYTQSKLQEIGVSTYRRIATLTEEEVAFVSEHLGYFTGRIQRDGWIESARQLHEEKYGEEV